MLTEMIIAKQKKKNKSTDQNNSEFIKQAFHMVIKESTKV